MEGAPGFTKAFKEYFDEIGIKVRENGVFRTILTTDEAYGFYEKNGYVKDVSIRALNKMDVYVKTLERK